MQARTFFGAALAVAQAMSGCAPDFGAAPSLVVSERLLAVRADPPEAAPGATVTLRALVVGPDGTRADPPVRWAWCLAPKPLTTDNSVADRCLGDGADVVLPLGGPGPAAQATLPADACARFGPDTPPATSGEPPARPRDPDVTGGYYQPARALVSGGDVAPLAGFGFARLTCNLAAAPIEVVQAFRRRYVANRNPTLDAVRATRSDDGSAMQPLRPEGDAQAAGHATVSPGGSLGLVARWSADSPETFPVFDREQRQLVEQREALRVSWYATAGRFEHDRTGRDGADTSLDSENEWTAPEQPGFVHLWVVLRDSRGGVDYRGYLIEVR